MSLGSAGRPVQKAGHPLIVAAAVLAVILVAATAYTFVGVQPVRDEPAQQAGRPIAAATVGSVGAGR